MTRSHAPIAGLTPKQALFVEHYVLDLNATQAAIRAGYSENSANQQAWRLLDNPSVRAAIDAAKVERSSKLGIDSERVLAEIAAIAFYDPADLVGVLRELSDSDELKEGECRIEVGNKLFAIVGINGPLQIRKLPRDIRRVIVGWSWDRNQNFTIKLADKSKALDQLARHLSLYNDRIAVETVDGLADRLERARRRGDEADEMAAPAYQPEPKPAAPKADAAHSAETSAPAPPPTPAPKPPPKPYKPIVPTVPWPEQASPALTDYDPLIND